MARRICRLSVGGIPDPDLVVEDVYFCDCGQNVPLKGAQVVPAHLHATERERQSNRWLRELAIKRKESGKPSIFMEYNRFDYDAFYNAHYARIAEERWKADNPEIGEWGVRLVRTVEDVTDDLLEELVGDPDSGLPGIWDNALDHYLDCIADFTSDNVQNCEAADVYQIAENSPAERRILRYALQLTGDWLDRVDAEDGVNTRINPA